MPGGDAPEEANSTGGDRGDGQSDGEPFSTQLDEFLHREYPIFAVMGVFGGVSTLLSSAASARGTPSSIASILSLGAVASLILFVLLGLYIDTKIWNKFASPSHFFRYISFHRKIGLATFLISFNLLIFAVTAATLNYPTAALLTASILAFVAGYYVQFEVQYLLGELIFDDFASPENRSIYDHIYVIGTSIVELAILAIILYLSLKRGIVLGPRSLIQSGSLLLIGEALLAGVASNLAVVLLLWIRD